MKREAASGSGFVDVCVKARPDRFFKVQGSDLRCDLRILNRPEVRILRGEAIR